MMTINSLLLAVLTLFGCEAPRNNALLEEQVAQQSMPSPMKFTLADAEKILGEPATLSTNTEGHDGSSGFHNIDYTANDTDRVSGKLGAVYCLIQRYSDTAGAVERYSFIKKANSGHEGVETLQGVGDEAYFHSDGTNFLFTMARKGKHVLTMKVNKVTSHTSRDAFNEVARRIVKEM